LALERAPLDAAVGAPAPRHPLLDGGEEEEADDRGHDERRGGGQRDGRSRLTRLGPADEGAQARPGEADGDGRGEDRQVLLGGRGGGEEEAGAGEEGDLANAEALPPPERAPGEEGEEDARHVEDLGLHPEDVDEGRRGEEEAAQEQSETGAEPGAETALA